MSTDLRILISGAGIGGLVCALALKARGFEPQVFEQATELCEVGAGVQLSSNATRVLFALGLEDRLMESAVEAQGKEIVRTWRRNGRRSRSAAATNGCSLTMHC